MVRLRLTYSKRGRACFIPHIAIPSVFARSGARASIPFQLSEGFAPRPRISLGPELPVGIPALSEPFEAWVRSFDPGMLRRWNECLPPGFSLTGGYAVPEGSTNEARALSKHCEAASCLLALRGEASPSPRFTACLEGLREAGEILSVTPAFMGDRPCLRCIVEAPSKRGPAALVRPLVEEGFVEGWADILLVREAVGRLVRGAAEGAEYGVVPLSSPPDGHR